MSVQGGAPVVLSDKVALAGTDWSDPEFVYFGGQDGRLYRAPAGGGTAEMLLDPAKTSDFGHIFPQARPGGRFTSR